MVLIHRRLRWRSALLLSATIFATVGQAAPVTGPPDPAEPDPYELALRWTLASVGPATAAAPAPSAAPALPRQPLGAVSALDGGVPDPGAYALMGLALLGAGLAARHLTRGQRGFSKKT